MRYASRLTTLGLFGLLALGWPAAVAANKPQAPVQATWVGAPPTTTVGQPLDLVLRLDSLSPTSQVIVELLPGSGLELSDATRTWSGVVTRGRPTELPVQARVVQQGDWTLGARISILDPGSSEVTGAVLGFVAENGVVRIGHGTPDVVRIATASTSAELQAVGLASPESARQAGRPVVGPRIPSTVSGTVRWRDPEGNEHPVRQALVQITDTAGSLLAETSTSDAGQYSAAINATQIRVQVFTQDRANTKVSVYPQGQPTVRYQLTTALLPVSSAATTVDLTSAATVRGTPGAPSTDSINARAFAVFDAMLTYWAQGSALIGRNHQRAQVMFPDAGFCGTSCYSSATQEMSILREDAFDLDVTGHEFFHFINNRSALRPIDNSPGGSHSGGSAIGENGRTRNQGMLLAWSEGFATVMPIVLQQSPLSPFGFAGLLNVGDAVYQDTEDSSNTKSMETPPRSEGFGSENSVMALLWDLTDGAQDSNGSATDTFAGANAPLLWRGVNSLLGSCNPCDRIDCFWVGLTDLFGQLSSTSLTLGELFSLNNMAALTTGPAEGASVAGTVAPTFTWVRAGDPADGHRNNNFYLVFSRDNFQSHRVPIAVPGDVTSYKPTDAEWQAVLGGGQPGQTYKWFVAATRSDGPRIPGSWFWYSDIRSVQPRRLEVILTWSPLGADVDLHLANPSGTDIAFYNTSTSWGFLDCDCITTCTQEIISVTSLPLVGSYRLFAHYYSSHGRGAASVRAVVKSGAQVLSDRSFVLGSTGATFTIASFNISSKETAVAEAPGVDEPLSPTSLPPKPK